MSLWRKLADIEVPPSKNAFLMNFYLTNNFLTHPYVYNTKQKR